MSCLKPFDVMGIVQIWETDTGDISIPEIEGSVLLFEILPVCAQLETDQGTLNPKLSS